MIVTEIVPEAEHGAGAKSWDKSSLVQHGIVDSVLLTWTRGISRRVDRRYPINRKLGTVVEPDQRRSKSQIVPHVADR